MSSSYRETLSHARRSGSDISSSFMALGKPCATRDLRRTFISQLIVGLGLDPVRVSKIAVHSNLSVTLDRYAEEVDRRCIVTTSSR
jgi:hypothetical protein